MNARLCCSLFLVSFCAAAARGQSTISTTDRYAYAANAGWLDWRPSATDGVRVADTFLAGSAYAANFGYVDFGNGAPANGHTYANTSATTYGVNLSPAGLLTGYAYAPNIGYLQFEQTLGQPVLDLLTGQFSGHAYSANVGWIALSTTFSSLATTSLSRPDSDGDGLPDPWERLHFGSLTRAASGTDYDGDGATDAAEYAAGTDPKDALSALRILSHSYPAARSQATLTFTISPTRKYRIEYNTALTGVWTNSSLGTITPAPGATATRTVITSVPPGPPRRYFRVVAVPPLP